MNASPPVKPAKPGKRAENKADKLRRITLAARALFVEKGFDGTTMRDIASGAGVGFGTLFDYASNKRDLLFLLVNPELEAILEEATAAAREEPLFIDKLMVLFGGYYTFYARERGISRIVLRELTFFTEGREAQRFADHRQSFIDTVQRTVEVAMDAGQLRQAPADRIARMLFAIFAWDVRRWLAGSHLSVMRGLADLREMVAFQIEGIAPDRADTRSDRGDAGTPHPKISHLQTRP